MKIIYGVSGEGSGHSSRAKLIGQWLVSQGHNLTMASYDRGYRNLKADFDVQEIVGLSIASEDNEVSKLKTITENLAKVPRGIQAFSQLKKQMETNKPDVIITDFEPCTAYLANILSIPLISLDNQHRMRYMQCEIPSEFKKDALVTETIIRAMIPKPWVSLVTTFHQGPLKNNHTFLFPPILRQEVLNKVPQQGDAILVYATSGFESLIPLLKQFNRERFLVYGFNREGTEDNLRYCGFSKTQFLTDLESAKAVIATAGFTLITESLYLEKPYLALPMQGQYEQHLNALMLKKQGFGTTITTLDAEHIGAFLYHLPDFRQKLKTYPKSGNELIQAKLAELLDDNLSQLMTFRR